MGAGQDRHEGLSREELIAIIEQLRAEVERLRRELEEANRRGKRQAAPFSRGEPKASPKRRGRKPGAEYGQRSGRGVPERVDRVVEVEAPAVCPACQGPVQIERSQSQYQTDLPRIEPVTTEFRIQVGRCRDCGHTVRARHPEQTSEAMGAAAVQIGPEAIGLATILNKECGVSYERICRLLTGTFHLPVARSTLCRSLLRVARRLEPTWTAVREQVRGSPTASIDDTGWRIGGHRAWLHVAATRDASLYTIAPGRGFAEMATLLGADYPGTITRDGWKPYGKFERARHQTCLAHLLRRMRDLGKLGLGQAADSWLAQAKRTLQRALALRQRMLAATIGEHGLAVAWGRLDADLDRLLATAPEARRIRTLAAHMANERGAMLTFLDEDRAPATNYLAEQALRPAVVNRKMSAGNNTPAGAHAQSILMTVLHTARKRLLDGAALVVRVLRNPASAPSILSLSGR